MIPLRLTAIASSRSSIQYSTYFGLVAIAAIFATALCLPACKGIGSSPSDGDIVEAVRSSLHKRLPVRASGFLGSAENVEVTDIRILERGEPQEDGTDRYWPVRVHVAGSYDANTPIGGLGRKQFKNELEFFVAKDPYGDWQAQPTAY